MSEMKLQDYLPFYMGCPCKTYSGKGRLISLDIDSGHWYVSLDTGGGTVGNINDTYRECPEESKQAFPDGYPPKSILKPILRKLEDITDEECWEMDEIDTMWVAGTNESYKSNRLYLYKQKVITWNNISPILFYFLLKKHFDVFGLIDSGLAIDASTTYLK